MNYRCVCKNGFYGNGYDICLRKLMYINHFGRRGIQVLKCHILIGFFVVYIDNGSSVPNIPSKLCGLADKNKKLLTEWK
jgi:hypothetical protein